jgi:hypothetical protein
MAFSDCQMGMHPAMRKHSFARICVIAFAQRFHHLSQLRPVRMDPERELDRR